MGLSRTQVSQQLVYLLNSTGVLGTNACLETALSVEDYLTSGLSFPMAMVETLESPWSNVTGRLAPGMFKVSIVGGAITEAEASNYVASGGSASSAHVLENAIQRILTALNSRNPGSFVASVHGFQGVVDSIHQNRIVVTPGMVYVATDFDIIVRDLTAVDYYHTPATFKAAAGASHTISLTWNNPPARFDQYQNVLRRGTLVGDPAPTTPIGGAGVAISGGVLGVAATDTLGGSGLRYNYALFRTYTKAASGDQTSGSALASATTT